MIIKTNIYFLNSLPIKKYIKFGRNLENHIVEDRRHQTKIEMTPHNVQRYIISKKVIIVVIFHISKHHGGIIS